MEKYILSVVVENNAGVLARISSLFGRRGFNIESLTVSPTTDPAISRITIVVTGDEYILGQIIKQVNKLEETIKIVHLDEKRSYCKELVFAKLCAQDKMTADRIREVCEVYGARIDDVDEEGRIIVVELTDIPSRIDGFLNVISNFEVVETCRTGVTALEKGDTRKQ